MKTNYHKWHRDELDTDHKEKLPPGRYLKNKEILRATDLICWKDAKAETVEKANDFRYRIGKVIGSDIEKPYRNLFYRPTVKKYRYLDIGEVIKNGDEIRFDNTQEKWNKVISNGTIVNTKVRIDEEKVFRRRRHVRTS